MKKISGWFIVWNGTKVPSNEMEKVIFIDQNGKPNNTAPIADFVEKYYISTLSLGDKISLASPKKRRDWHYKSRVEYNKKKKAYIISCGHNPWITAEYKKDIPIPDKEYKAWFPK